MIFIFEKTPNNNPNNVILIYWKIVLWFLLWSLNVENAFSDKLYQTVTYNSIWCLIKMVYNLRMT